MPYSSYITCLTNHMGFISRRIMPLVINNLRGKHTHIHTHTNTHTQTHTYTHTHTHNHTITHTYRRLHRTVLETRCSPAYGQHTLSLKRDANEQSHIDWAWLMCRNVPSQKADLAIHSWLCQKYVYKATINTIVVSGYLDILTNKYQTIC